jgi:hypothetical protein
MIIEPARFEVCIEEIYRPLQNHFLYIHKSKNPNSIV